MAQFCGDSRCVYVYRQGEAPSRVYKLDLATGRRELRRTLMPADAIGVSEIPPLINPPPAWVSAI